MAHEKDDHFIFDVVDAPHSRLGKQARAISPSKVINITSIEELKSQLEHYSSRPFLKHLLPDSTFARKNYVTLIRPALRYYCQKYQVKIPEWLKDDSQYTNMPDDKKKDMFGTTDLKIKEFQPIKRLSGATQVSKG